MLHAKTKREQRLTDEHIRQLKGDRQRLRQQCDRNVARMIRTQEVR